MQEILDNAQIFNGVDNSSQPDNAQLFRRRPGWKTDAINPLFVDNNSDLIITDVSQAHKLEQVRALSAIPNECQTTEEWLENHSLVYQELTLKDLLAKGKQVKKFGVDTHMVFSGTVINEFEYKLNSAIQIYHDRVKWLLKGTRKTFGLIKGDRVGILIDSSDSNTGFGRLQVLQKALMSLIDEQLSTKKSLYFMTFGTDIDCLWHVARDVNSRILEEARDFVKDMKSCGGCNLLKALKRAMKVKRLNSLVVILGGCPDQGSDPVYDYVEQCLLGKHLPIHAIAYDTTHHKAHTALQKLADKSKGRYHYYNSSEIRDSYKSKDVALLLRESQRTLDMISKIKQMRTGMLGNALICIENEIVLEVEHRSLSRFLPRPANHHQPLSIHKPDFHPTNSKLWLKEHGLRAKKLNLYQVLALDAFDPVQDFVPVLKKSVKSRVNEVAMQQFEWHDGSIKNIHVDVAMLYDYQKKLGQAVNTYEARIEWLASANRRIWGTICEKKVIFLIDTSLSNKPYLVHLQHSLRLLLEEQIVNKDAFNLIAFGSHPNMWMPQMVKPTEENLQAAWRWALHLETGGSRNFLSAFRFATENSNDIQMHDGAVGLYYIGSGIPDQSEDVACSFVSEKSFGSHLKLHTILFCIDDYNQHSEMPSRYADLTQTASYLRNLAHHGDGRFHWFRESGIIESDDVTAVMQEMERAVFYSQRCATLVNAVTPRRDKSLIGIEPRKVKKVIVPPLMEHPRQTALSLAREQQAIRGGSHKCLAWRVPKKNATLPPAPYKVLQQSNFEKTSQSPKVEPFYTEKRGNVGIVFKKYPTKKSVRKAIPEPILPDIEATLTSKQWLKYYGINKLKLNLNRYVSGPVCVHEKTNVKSTGGQTHAKWFCSIFPSVEVNDKIRHIDMNIKEIDDYVTQLTRVGKRYLQRMQWLSSGSRKTFGVVIESRVIILVDISGSMNDHLTELKNELKHLIWEQIRNNCKAFNVISFSDHIASWQGKTTDVSDATCNDATSWVASLHAHGGTMTLEALKDALADQSTEALYLLSDGKPDTSIKLTLANVARANRRQIPIHTILFNSNDSNQAMFLANLAHQSGGRYHVCKGHRDVNLMAYNMISEGFLDEDAPTLPDFQGDDLKRLRTEITTARKYITQAKLYKKIVEQHKEECISYGQSTSMLQNETKVLSRRPFLP